MGTTPIFGLPYPEPADPLTAYPALAKSNAQKVEAAIGVGPASPRMSRSKSFAQTLTANTWTVIGFDVEDTGTVGISYSGGIFQLSQAGIYQVNIVAYFNGATTGNAQISAYVGSVRWSLLLAPLTGNLSFAQSRAIKMAATDTVSVQANISAGGSVYGSSSRWTTIDITRISA